MVVEAQRSQQSDASRHYERYSLVGDILDGLDKDWDNTPARQWKGTLVHGVLFATSIVLEGRGVGLEIRNFRTLKRKYNAFKAHIDEFVRGQSVTEGSLYRAQDLSQTTRAVIYPVLTPRPQRI